MEMGQAMLQEEQGQDPDPEIEIRDEDPDRTSCNKKK